MKQSYQIRWMYCPNCEKRIRTALGKMDGVKAVRVDYASGRAALSGMIDSVQLGAVLLSLSLLGLITLAPGGEKRCAGD